MGATAEVSVSGMHGILPAGFLKEREVEPVGRWFLSHWSRINSGRSFSHRLISEPSLDETVEEDGGEEEFEDDLPYLKKVDIKDKKKQDYYRILGLTKQRIHATDDQIKKAHRQKALKHHPDKRKARGEQVKEKDDYYCVITKAFETLMNPEARRAFDSVDPTFDDSVPNIMTQEKTLTTEEEIKQKVLQRLKEKRKSTGTPDKRKSTGTPDKRKSTGTPDKRKSAGDKKKSKGDDKKSAEEDVKEVEEKDVKEVKEKETKDDDFFSVFGPVFEKNSRWSLKTPVPQLGNLETTSMEKAEEFYSFWYSFQSWREYSHLDEEDKEQAENRWERREIEKENKVQRKEMKADETKRIFKLVENAYKSDPRIAKFKEDEKNEKIAKKQAKLDIVQAAKDEEERIVREKAEAERKEKEEKEGMASAKKNAEKKEKEERKKALKVERKKLRNIAKEENYFCQDENEKLSNILEIEKMCEMYSQMQLKELVDKLDEDRVGAKQVFMEELHKVNPELAKAQIEASEKVGLVLNIAKEALTGAEEMPSNILTSDISKEQASPAAC